nr:MAG TPA: Mature oligodendrocyte transmembrane protein [Caudoviricetes sp.]
MGVFCVARCFCINAKKVAFPISFVVYYYKEGGR